VASAFATILATALLFERGERDDVSVYLRQVDDVQGSFALRYARVDPAYGRLESSPDSVGGQLPELRRTAHTLTVLRERAEGAPDAALELRRRLIAYFREQVLIAQELVKVAAFVGEIQQTERSITRAGGVLRGRLGTAAGAEDQAAAAGATYAKRLEAEAEHLARLDAPPVVASAQREHVESLRAHAAAVRKLVDAGSWRRPFAKSAPRRWRSRPTRQPGPNGRRRARTTPGALAHGSYESNSSGSGEVSSASASSGCARRESARADPRRAKIPEGGRFAAAVAAKSP
jgi:hypothetical protein